MARACLGGAPPTGEEESDSFQLAHHGSVTGGCCEQEQAAVILSVVQALLGQAELALTDRQLRQLLPLLL
ncbi:hypothetical protein EYF80_012663 [Liparis tanakae]|uniref:Uncharacterized protein n=1 Tax=Liparis tanakae TaxID=230148 RepID=A0A4Z2IH55_9TELE|nr:hypothetical protein EYF80_012663 [Liparis tanakae]